MSKRLLKLDFIKVAARSSPLSRVQVEEVLQELKEHRPSIDFDTLFLETTGDIDQKTSLRTLDKTDFFTKEIDRLVLDGKVRAGIHSAKDLPDPLPDGLSIACLTEGIDSSDVIVLRNGETLAQDALIGTSSENREERVRKILPSCRFVDIRGTIGQRLAKLQIGSVDGVVIANAALLRLNLVDLNKVRLPGESTPYQGQLAVVCKKGDQELMDLFSCIDCRPRCLWTGLEAPSSTLEIAYDHLPLIECKPLDEKAPDMQSATHFLFTSKTAVELFLKQCTLKKDAMILTVGKKTAQSLNQRGYEVDKIAESECSEGVVEMLKTIDLSKATLCYPHSKNARDVILNYLKAEKIAFIEWLLYETNPKKPKTCPDFKRYSEIFFTSPSCVRAFLQFFGPFPNRVEIKAIGPATQEELENLKAHNQST